MAVLQVSLFGSMKVIRAHEQSKLKLTRTIQLLLAYLLLERHRLHSRDVLSDLFWGEYSQDRARRCLNTSLWRLRQAIEGDESDAESFLVVSEVGEVGFNAGSDYWLDVAAFEECVKRVKTRPFESVRPSEVEELEANLQLYVGDLLEGIYTDWAIRAREYERLLYLDSLRYLMGYYKQQNAFVRSLEFGKKILEIDPLREEIHCEMMRLYHATGQRTLAIRQYEICRQSLKAELGIPPLEETERVYAQVIAPPSTHQLSSAVWENLDLVEMLQYMQQTARNLELAQEQFQKAVQRLETLVLAKKEIEEINCD